MAKQRSKSWIGTDNRVVTAPQRVSRVRVSGEQCPTCGPVRPSGGSARCATGLGRGNVGRCRVHGAGGLKRAFKRLDASAQLFDFLRGWHTQAGKRASDTLFKNSAQAIPGTRRTGSSCCQLADALRSFGPLPFCQRFRSLLHFHALLDQRLECFCSFGVRVRLSAGQRPQAGQPDVVRGLLHGVWWRGRWRCGAASGRLGDHGVDLGGDDEKSKVPIIRLQMPHGACKIIHAFARPACASGVVRCGVTIQRGSDP